VDVTDVLYIVRRGDRNEELRYSLRSLANLPHGTVWIVGHRPKWVQGVEHIPGNRFMQSWYNVFDNLRIATEQVPAPRFVVMNDDFFILRPTRRLPSLVRGLLADHLAISRGWWRATLLATVQHLEAACIEAPLSYELHVPVLMERDKLGEVLAAAKMRPMPPQWRTLYGNVHRVPAEVALDVKLRNRRHEWSTDTAFLSTEDWTFREVLPFLADRFPLPSPYERAEAVAA
jgi:hypothetical protein